MSAQPILAPAVAAVAPLVAVAAAEGLGGGALAFAVAIGAGAVAAGAAFLRRSAPAAGGTLDAYAARLAAGDTVAPAALPSTPLGRSLSAIGSALRRAEAFRKGVEEERAAADQRMRRRDRVIGDFDASAKTLLATVAETMTHLEETAGDLRRQAEESSARSASVSEAVNGAATNVEAVAAAAEQLSASVHEISRQVAESTRITAEAVQTVDGANEIVAELSTAAGQIGEIVSLITDIASQTNLLALNATIEAARAGEAGKGFAVVANEVKNLATQTARATDEISARVAEMQASSQAAAKGLADIARIVGRVDEVVSSIAASVEEQSAATQEIARNAQEAAQGNGVAASSVAGLSAVAERTDGLAGAMLGVAHTLGEETDSLRGQIETFLKEMKVADIKGRIIMLAASLMAPEQLARAEQVLTRRTGLTIAAMDPDGWYNTAVFDAFLQEYAQGSGRGDTAIRDIGRLVYPTLKKAGALPDVHKTPLEWLLFEGEGFLQNHQGNEVRPRNFLSAEDGHVVVEAVAPGYNPALFAGVYEGILEFAGITTYEVTQKPGSIFEITWTAEGRAAA